MKLIKADVKFIPQTNILEHIEKAGRVCYKSEPKGKPEAFVENLIKRGHYSVLEHGTVYLQFNKTKKPKCNEWKKHFVETKVLYSHFIQFLINMFNNSPWHRVTFDDENIYITTNYRFIIENGYEYLLNYAVTPTLLHRKRYSFKFVTDRGVWNEFIRHKSPREDDIERLASFSQESTRYCNYSLEKFGNELSFIKPLWCHLNYGEYHIDNGYMCGDGYIKSDVDTADDRFLLNCLYTEADYMDLLEKKLPPEDARAVLTNAVATTLFMTLFEDDLKHFLDLRYYGKTGKPHPEAAFLCCKMIAELNKAGIESFNAF